VYIRPALTRVVLVIFVVGGVVAVSGCYDPRIRPCAVTCATESDCTGDQTCRGGVCQGPSDSCPTGGDADVDGPDDGDGGIDAMPTGTWREMSVGAFHTCAIKSADGALFCWGNNDHRQIGVASPIRTGTLSPVSAGAQTTGWEHVAAGWWHTCATRADGSLWCWGKNDSMQCGQASSPFASPARVNDPAGLSGTRWTAVTVGASFTCALRDDGTLWCFGGGGSGQLGQGTVDASSQLPARVGTRTDWRAVDAGFTHACGIYKPSGERARIACWGNDASQGRLGDGNVGMNRYVPTDVADNGASDWQSLSASDYATCAIEAAGQLWCWGDQYHVPGGVLSTTPTRFGTVTGYDRVSLGAFGGCFVLDGTVLCYGYNYDGAVGYPPTSPASPRSAPARNTAARSTEPACSRAGAIAATASSATTSSAIRTYRPRCSRTIIRGATCGSRPSTPARSRWPARCGAGATTGRDSSAAASRWASTTSSRSPSPPPARSIA
jgi:hypothetical protein